jgi:crotonobetainyl-CoA:carnitine CoA-transferase CaiB-like acyl-CoA transferase
MKILGLETDERFTTFAGRMEHRELLQELMGKWCATRTRDEVVAIFEEAEAAVGPVFDMSDIASDPHYAARNMIQIVGDTPMQGLIAALSKTPGVLRHEGCGVDEHGTEIRRGGWKPTSSD